jgi:hypothetical protein
MTPGKYPEEHTQYSEHGESLKSRILFLILSFLEIRAERRQKSISVEMSFVMVFAFKHHVYICIFPIHNSGIISINAL